MQFNGKLAVERNQCVPTL